MVIWALIYLLNFSELVKFCICLGKFIQSFVLNWLNCSLELENPFLAENALSTVVQSENAFLLKPDSLRQRNMEWLKSSEMIQTVKKSEWSKQRTPLKKIK